MPTARLRWQSRFGFIAGRMVNRFGPRRLMLGGIVMAGLALVGLSYATTMGVFYLFYAFNALGYVCGGPLPNQVLLSRWFDKGRGKAMGVAYLGIGVGGALVPLLAYNLTQSLGWRGAMWWLGGPDDRGRAAGCVFRTRAAGSGCLCSRGRPTIAGSDPLPSRIFPSARRRRRIDRCGRRDDAEPGVVFHSIASLRRSMSDATLSLILIGSLAGRLFMGWLADRVAKKRVMILIYLIVAAAIPPLFYAPTPATLKVFAFLCLGLGSAAIT